MNTFDLNKYELSIYNLMSTFLVVGAFDGEGHDTFLPLILQKENKLGSKIVFVEPVKYWFDRLKEKVSNISDFEIECYNLAISDKIGKDMVVSVKPGLQWKYGPYIDECSCLLEDGVLSSHVIGDVQLKDVNISEVNSMTLDYLMTISNLKTIDVLKIDTEGHDERILRTINFDKIKVKFLKFEKTFLSEGFIEEICSKLTQMGYLINVSDDNVHFVHKDVIETINNK